MGSTRTQVIGDEMTIKNGSKHPVLKLEGVRKVFSPGTVDEVVALDGIDHEVKSGDFVTIIGSNGAGKSTLLNLIAGMFPPERGGKIHIDGADVTNLKEYRHAAYTGRVWQDPSVGTAKILTIEENLSLALSRGKKRKLVHAINKNRRSLFIKALKPLGLELEDRLTCPVGTLSGGQRQALSLVMATISQPALLLLDEHIAALDPTTARTVMGLTSKIVNHEKITTLMVTHDMEIALEVGNRLIMMHKGRIILDLDEKAKSSLTISDLISAFEKASGDKFADDKVLLKGGD
jgi:putative tryptophan/tyrosine transport system ATP-binding protein